MALIDSAQRENKKAAHDARLFYYPLMAVSSHRYSRKLLEYFHSSRVFTRE
ncbi:hypothetical protein AB8A05_16635 [Tardiphaga sp. 538_B7_N1_4]|uniref:hypothetical protein n=1 Tax=Tardiphaga sp. 538_B7_N1_4 TaxID=3240778 RepID=UPI003F21F777